MQKKCIFDFDTNCNPDRCLSSIESIPKRKYDLLKFNMSLTTIELKKTD